MLRTAAALLLTAPLFDEMPAGIMNVSVPLLMDVFNMLRPKKTKRAGLN